MQASAFLADSYAKHSGNEAVCGMQFLRSCRRLRFGVVRTLRDDLPRPEPIGVLEISEKL